MKILVIGSGAREHAICNNLIKNSNVSKVYCAPGNEVKATKNCKIVKILVEDGQIVKKGDKLFEIE